MIETNNLSNHSNVCLKPIPFFEKDLLTHKKSAKFLNWFANSAIQNIKIGLNQKANKKLYNKKKLKKKKHFRFRIDRL